MSAASSSSSLLARIGRVKLKDFPEFVRKSATEYDYKGRATQFAEEYKRKHIDTGSVTPLWHFMGGVFGIAYVTVWPTEYRHMMAERRGGHH